MRLLAQKHWKVLLALIGVAGLSDLLKEFIRHEAMAWISDRLGAAGGWLIGNPTAFVTLALGIVLCALAVTAVRDSAWPPPSAILDPSERPYGGPIQIRSTLVFGFTTTLALLLVAFGSYRYYRRGETPPLKPTSLDAHFVRTVPFHDQRVTLGPQTKDTPCRFKRHGPYASVEALPGGAGYKEPYLVIEPKTLYVVYASGKEEDARVFVELLVVNRGESSIAKDWSLCLVSEGHASWYEPQEVTKNDESYLGARRPLPDVASHPIEHGNAVRGWLLFRVPRDLSTGWEFTGGLRCRDYLEHEYAAEFSPS